MPVVPALSRRFKLERTLHVQTRLQVHAASPDLGAEGGLRREEEAGEDDGCQKSSKPKFEACESRVTIRIRGSSQGRRTSQRSIPKKPILCADLPCPYRPPPHIDPSTPRHPSSCYPLQDPGAPPQDAKNRIHVRFEDLQGALEVHEASRKFWEEDQVWS
ncbi:hypothetical protein KM043_002501 [Ampulex compressa]|nr:hypothetical protein KM043_002501 [Ampulex compressa]